jgi:hypothetical protein
MTDENWRVLSDYYEPARDRQQTDEPGPPSVAASTGVASIDERPRQDPAVNRSADVDPLRAANVLVSAGAVAMSGRAIGAGAALGLGAPRSQMRQGASGTDSRALRSSSAHIGPVR